jgi:hypothetical protein
LGLGIGNWVFCRLGLGIGVKDWDWDWELGIGFFDGLGISTKYSTFCIDLFDKHEDKKNYKM